MMKKSNAENYPLVSILLASYNSAKVLHNCVRSVLAQTYPNIQVIICDDGSSDFDYSYVQTLLGSNTSSFSYKIIHHEQNIGTVKNLNAGLAAADGEWISVLAADDCFASNNAVTALLSQLQASGKIWGIARTELCDERIQSAHGVLPGPKTENLIKKELILELYEQLCIECCLPAGGAIYSAALLKSLGGFDEHYRLVEDWPLFLKLIRQGILPEISDGISVLHRQGGVSTASAGKKGAYQRDLITVFHREVIPHLDIMEVSKQIKIQKTVRDKEAIYQLRFECPDALKKAKWAFTHIDLIFKKLMRRRDDNGD